MDLVAFVIPRAQHILAREGLVHQLVRIGRAVIDAALHDERGVAALDGRLVVFVLMRQIPPGDIFAVAPAVCIEADILAHAPEQAEVGIGVFGPLVEPGEKIVVGLDLLIALQRAAEPDRLQPVAAEMFEDRPGAGDVGQRRRAHHAARNHVARMRPLPAEQRVDFDRPAGDGDADLVIRAGERRPALDRLLVELTARIGLVGVVDHEQAVVMARQALQRFRQLPEVAREDRVARHGRAPGGVERPGGQVRCEAPQMPHRGASRRDPPADPYRAG